jgi:nucleoside-diphosphate-sugar epimerase
MKILQLGTTGLIGSELAFRLESSHQVTKINRNSNLEKFFKEPQAYDFVINCVVSKPYSNLAESNESNFEYPKKFLEHVQTKHWVQLESYFQLQIPMGRHDSYTLEKQRFSEYLDLIAESQSSLLIHHLFLPHVFGDGDRPERLISSAILALRNGQKFETSTGTQFLPILHKSEAVSGIVSFLDNPTSVACCHPFWYGQVRELLTLISSVFNAAQIAFCQKSDPIDSHFPPVQFPEIVNNWHPKMQLIDFLDWVRIQSE